MPTHGLDRDGTRRVAFKEGEAVFRVARNSATLDWFNDAGKQLKSPSKAMKDEKELFKEVQSDLKELNADLAIQPQRLPAVLSAVSLLAGRYLAHALSRSSAAAWLCAQAGLVDRPTGWHERRDAPRRGGRVVARRRRTSGLAGRCDGAIVAPDGCRGRCGRGLARPAGGVAGNPAFRAGLARGLRADRCRTRHRNLYQPLGRSHSQAAPGHDARAAQWMARDAPHVRRCPE